MKNIIYKIGFLLLALAITFSCTSPEGETDYTPASYEYPTAINLEEVNATNSSIDFTYSVSGSGTGYYVVVEDGSPAPSNQDVYDGSADGMVDSGSFDLAGSAVSLSTTDLCDGTSYVVYAVQFTSDRFLSETPQSITITTVENASIAGTYDVVSNGYNDWYGEDVVDFLGTVTITDNGDGTFNFDDISAGYYTEYYGGYGAGAIPKDFPAFDCNIISGAFTTPFYNCCDDYIIWEGMINLDGTISVHWTSNFFADDINAVFTKQ